jgi:hypothetical protein
LTGTGPGKARLALVPLYKPARYIPSLIYRLRSVDIDVFEGAALQSFTEGRWLRDFYRVLSNDPAVTLSW